MIAMSLQGQLPRSLGCAPSDEATENEKLKSGQITQLAFTCDGKNLVVVNEFRDWNTQRKKVHCRLRTVLTADWKVAADTGELSLNELALAPCSGKSWMIRAQNFDRFGK